MQSVFGITGFRCYLGIWIHLISLLLEGRRKSGGERERERGRNGKQTHGFSNNYIALPWQRRFRGGGSLLLCPRYIPAIAASWRQHSTYYQCSLLIPIYNQKLFENPSSYNNEIEDAHFYTVQSGDGKIFRCDFF